MADAAFQAAKYRKITIFGLIPEDADKSIVDEILAYSFAAAGFYTQFYNGFSIPAPWNLILWPLEVAEWYIRWSITDKKT